MEKVRLVIRESGEDLPRWTNEASGTWSYLANRVGDPIFSSFLDSVLVSGEEVKGLEITGSVRDIIIAEWDSYISLVEWMQSPTLTLPMYTLLGQVGYGSVNEEHPFLVMRDLSRIRYILNMPEGWESWVILDYEVDLNHLRLMGEGALADNGGEPLWHREEQPEANFCLWFMSEVADVVEEEYKSDFIVLLSGILRNALLEHAAVQTNAETLHTLYTQQVRWDVLLTALDEIGMDSDSKAYNSILTLAGRGLPDKSTISIARALRFDYNGSTLPLELNDREVSHLYSVAIATLPFEVDMTALGLDGINHLGTSSVTGVAIRAIASVLRRVGVRNSLLLIVPIVHTRIVNLLRHYASKVGWPYVLGTKGNEEADLRAVASLFKSQLDRIGLERILLAMFKETLAKSNTTAFTRAFTRAIEDALSSQTSPTQITETVLTKTLLSLTFPK